MTKSLFVALVLTSLPAPSSIQLRPGQTEYEALAARKDALAETLRLTYPDEVLPAGLARAYRVASDGVPLPETTDKTYGGIKGRNETTRQIADLLSSNDPEDQGSLGDVAKFWAKRADEIEAQSADLIANGKHPAQIAAIVATLRREAKALDEHLITLAASV